MAWDMVAETALSIRSRTGPLRMPAQGHYLHTGAIGNANFLLGIPNEVVRFRTVPVGELSAFTPGFNWSVLETAPGVYDFSQVRAFLDECQAKKIFMGVNFLWKHFAFTASDPQKTQGNVMPLWLVNQGLQVRTGDFRGLHAAIWDSRVEAAIKDLITALYKEFADHPYFCGMEITESAGVDNNGDPVRYISTSPYYEFLPGYSGTGYTHAGFERAYGRIMNHAATLRPDMIMWGTPNLWPRGSDDASHIAGWTNCFNECTPSANLICGGPDILCNSSVNLRNSYDRYRTNDTPFYYHHKKCAMQYDSAELETNGNHHISALWKAGRDSLGLEVIQWNYYGASNVAPRDFNHSDVLAAIAGTTPITRYQGSSYAGLCASLP